MSDQTETNKRLAVALLEASGKHDGPAFAALMHPEATWETVGKPHLFAYAGVQSRDKICAYMASPSIFVGGVETRFGDITAEDDRVAVEAATKGTLPDGRVYTNTYHYLFTFRDGLVWRVKEYIDTQSAAEFFAK
ncbi:MAG: nuclear transport factor 2 family protein [Novosphingobium sp.]|nr:MAG: nuclear transport factor 2 family protein [Novosphingobium sp.]